MHKTTNKTMSSEYASDIRSLSVVDQAVSQLDAWFETMRGAMGYGGPVAHWWKQCLLYTGPGLDWRYEGIIAGYVSLWKHSGDHVWLDKAIRAGEDLLKGQLANAHFTASAFEINPASAGTPHEAACDVALLTLAKALKIQGVVHWEKYAQAAEKNLDAFYIGQLWDPGMKYFRDSTSVLSFVPNKAATACEALFLRAELRGEDNWVEEYILPTLERILCHQITDGCFDGAIIQNSFGHLRIEKFFPLYIARCIPVLTRSYQWTRKERYLDAALRAATFISRWIYPDGSLPTVIYSDRSINRWPAWIAPLGDVLRAFSLVSQFGFDAELETMQTRLLLGQDLSGGIQTAYGFEAQTGGRPKSLPDVRDVLHVVGWCDKSFRYLAELASSPVANGVSGTVEVDCTFQGAYLQFLETPTELTILRKGRVVYRWFKGSSWAESAAQPFWTS